MDKNVEKSMNLIQVEQYESPRIEVIELEIEDAVLTGISSATYESWE